MESVYLSGDERTTYLAMLFYRSPEILDARELKTKYGFDNMKPSEIEKIINELKERNLAKSKEVKNRLNYFFEFHPNYDESQYKKVYEWDTVIIEIDTAPHGFWGVDYFDIKLSSKNKCDLKNKLEMMLQNLPELTRSVSKEDESARLIGRPLL